LACCAAFRVSVPLQQPLVIETASKATAKCIADALEEFGTELRKNGER
jgi:hypothetical protein